MNLSMKWLSDYVTLDTTVKEFCAAMTMSGSKVEVATEEGSEIKNVVVGKLLSVVPHENSDHLVVCQVDVGQEQPIQIVTGAPNVKAGDIVPVALCGAELPNGVKIKKGKLRGVESNGMLCSLGELGLTVHDFPYAIADGIFLIQEDCQIGQDIHEAIGLNDTSVEFEITSNRPDCLSVTGLAREAAATYHVPLNLKKPTFQGIDGNIQDELQVEIQNKEKCPRYAAGIVKNVKIAPSPRWMRERLRASGVRPINNLVDITNYVMLEYGQPMHAFDLRYVKDGKIVVRNAAKGETITTLDGVTRTLSPEMLVIADAEKPIAVAGVMGGEYSGIMEDTNTVVFESAYFEPVQVRRTAKKLGMRTDASARYEKGLDPEGCLRTLERAFELVELLGAGEPVRTHIDLNYNEKQRNRIPFDPEWINKFLGTDISREEMCDTMKMLEIEVDGDTCISPSFRIDLERPADLAEEVARIYGYNNIPSTVIKGVANASLTPKQKFRRTLENATVAVGCYGILTYSFISPKYFDKIALPADSSLRKTVVISNPLGEDTSVMRTTTLPSMLETLSLNYKNRNAAVALYEIGKEYLPTAPDKLPEEPDRLTIGMYGDDADFFTLKGMVETILETAGLHDCTYKACGTDAPFGEICALHPGRSAVIYAGETPIGYLGEVHPTVQKNYEIGTRTYVAKLLIDEMQPLAQTEITYQPLPKFPAITRDLSLVCADKVPVGDLQAAMKKAVGNILEQITLFDVYKGEQIAAGMKSVSFSIRMRSHEGTLTDEQADAAMKRVLKALKEHGATLRA
ncbi:MAG: phenylalanine--tRNA ligase subunit beta [Ruminococcus sp.]|jgi:phenylalanyl-tRNA synthetase beta chain|nr:phenylalanine--tRNA ligase subunit beta [Ruminococcus sp.]